MIVRNIFSPEIGARMGIIPKSTSIFSILLLSFTFVMVLGGCKKSGPVSDAYGNFEADEIIVSAESAGKLIRFTVEEGQSLKAGSEVGLVDTAMINLQKKQIYAQRAAISTKSGNIISQMDVLKEELAVIEIERVRVENLLKEEAATQRQMDEILGKMKVIQSKIKSIETQNSSVFSEIRSIDAKVPLLDEQINKCRIINPIDGTVLVTMAAQSEITFPGKNLYKIAPLDYLYLRAYLSGSQLSAVSIGQEVNVLVDKSESENMTLKGKITWISSKAEFTPKIVQTKEERVNLVYAFKIKVANDGSLKIGMPGEVKF